MRNNRRHFGLLGLAAILLLAGCSGGPTSLGGAGATQSTEALAVSGAATGYSGTLPQGPAEGGRQVIEHPTMADLSMPGPLPEHVLGSADAPVTVIEYASLTCPYCRAFHQETFPRVRKELIDTGKVRWILREFPIGRASGTAWIVTSCTTEKRFFPLYERYLKEQASWVSQEVQLDAIFAVAAKAGMSRSEFDKCLANQSIEAGLKWVKERGRQLGVSGTPTFFFNETKVRSMLTFAQVKELVEGATAPKVAASASN